VILAGGDYFDVFRLDKKHIVLVVGDAAGHGMRACMSIMVMQTLMRMVHQRLFRKTSAFVAEINRRFCASGASQTDSSLVTLLYGVLRTDKHVFSWTSAGHPVPILHDRHELAVEPVAANDVAGVPLGVDPGMTYEGFQLQIPRGGRLLLYSDGLVEAFPSEDTSRQFGTVGVQKTMLRTGGLSPAETLQALLDASHKFTQGAGRHDDTSALLLERR